MRLLACIEGSLGTEKHARRVEADSYIAQVLQGW